MTRNDKIAVAIGAAGFALALGTGLYWPRHEENVIRDYVLQDRRVTIQVLPGRHVTPYRMPFKARPAPYKVPSSCPNPPTAMLNDAPAPLPDAAIVFPGPQDTYSDPGQPGDAELGALVAPSIGLLPGGGAYVAPPAPIPAHTASGGRGPHYASAAEPPTWSVALVGMLFLAYRFWRDGK